jgi:hypothetical protein
MSPPERNPGPEETDSSLFQGDSFPRRTVLIEEMRNGLDQGHNGYEKDIGGALIQGISLHAQLRPRCS